MLPVLHPCAYAPLIAALLWAERLRLYHTSAHVRKWIAAGKVFTPRMLD